MGTFQTQTVWDRSGGGHRDVVLTKMIEGRARPQSPLDDWISLGATQVAMELHGAPPALPPGSVARYSRRHV
jgi:hypothetical protein